MILFLYFRSLFSPDWENIPSKCLNTFPNSSKFVKNTPQRVVFSTIFSVFGDVVKHGIPCLKYVINQLNTSDEVLKRHFDIK